ncbi:MAG: ACP S-malonyltransferase [Pseudomonadota bacterium]|nr:ACP S-malonyltransferase [Pseudomonadota bacterium]
MASVYLFPGQGSQKVGMAQTLINEFPVAKQTFEEANDILGENLLELCINGPEDTLRLTQNAQPALLTHSIAALRVLEEKEGFTANYVAGHSLGEYSALVAAGVLSFADAVRLVRIRGNAMIEAVPAGLGAMAALVGVEFELAQSICDGVEGIVVPANMNGGGQIVISGAKEAVELAMAAAKEQGVKRVVPLPVSGPFHSPLMQPAADRMKEALADIQLNEFKVPVIANVLAEPVSDITVVKDLLVQQVTGAVRWEETMQQLANLEVTEGTEIGSGNVLSGLMRRSQKGITVRLRGEAADFA